VFLGRRNAHVVANADRVGLDLAHAERLAAADRPERSRGPMRR
jgi:hypothetical protein